MPPSRLKGVLSPVVTPFRYDLSADPERFVRHCQWLLAHGCSGLAVFGTNSEANSLAAEERIALLEALVGGGVPAEKLLPGTGCCALPDSVKLTAHALKLGCAGVLMLPPFYYKGVPDEGLYRNFSEVIQRVGDEGGDLAFRRRLGVGYGASTAGGTLGARPRRRNCRAHRPRLRHAGITSVATAAGERSWSRCCGSDWFGIIALRRVARSHSAIHERLLPPPHSGRLEWEVWAEPNPV
jgi:hypothetical protein